MFSGIIHPLSGTDELNDARFAIKVMASRVSLVPVKPGQFGRFPFKRITTEIRDGNPKLHDLMRWYPRAAELMRNK